MISKQIAKIFPIILGIASSDATWLNIYLHYAAGFEPKWNFCIYIFIYTHTQKKVEFQVVFVFIYLHYALRSAGAANKLEEAGFQNIACITSGLQSVKPGYTLIPPPSWLLLLGKK